MRRDHCAAKGTVGHVRRYSRAIREAALAQFDGDLVCSPLGIWLLLCACTSAASGRDRKALERVVGCSAQEAGDLLAGVLADVPPKVRAAVALWVRASVETDAVRGWRDRLPEGVERGPMPSQAGANRWARRETFGLIPAFPADVAAWDLILASALATKVSWTLPYQVGSTRERFSATSPWRNQVEHVLFTTRPADSAIVKTKAAGLVAVHDAVAREDGVVVSCVAAAPGVDRAQVLAAAHEISARHDRRERLAPVSLFDVPLGDGHSWTIAERETRTHTRGERIERITGVTVPAWQINSELDLLQGPEFGAALACDVLGGLLPARGLTDARQTALAAFDRRGFKAAAITSMAGAVSAPRTPTERGVERTAVLRFDHPFAAVALIAGRLPADSEHLRGLPVFEAWVQTPGEVPAEQLDQPEARATPPRSRRETSPPRSSPTRDRAQPYDWCDEDWQ